MISISDIEEPTCPRSPPASVRTTSRRSAIERSSSGGVVSDWAEWAARAAFAVAIVSVLHLLRQCCQERTGVIELPRLGIVPARRVAGQDPPLPALRNELV